jgi:CheY-like chemotaxis protein
MNTTPARILLAEDDRFLSKAAAVMLRRRGYTVVTASNGEEALQSVRSAPPDIVLLDLIMPKMQGFEVLRALKSDAATRAIPVVVMSNLSQPEDRDRTLAAGASEYLVKANLSLEALVSAVERTLRERR